jgi:uncharacterized membrane protein YphA (DoxX/SURF4 family)
MLTHSEMAEINTEMLATTTGEVGPSSIPLWPPAKAAVGPGVPDDSLLPRTPCVSTSATFYQAELYMFRRRGDLDRADNRPEHSPILKIYMPEGETATGELSLQPAILKEQKRWQIILNWTCAILIAVVFLAAGLWKASDPTGAAVKLAQVKVPQSLSVFAAVMFGIAETFTGVLLVIPRFRRWGSWLASLLLIAFMVFIGIHYTELVGTDCSCFPWLKRAVGPQFFVGDGIMLLLAIGAGVWSPKPHSLRNATLVLAAVAVFAGISYGVAATRHTGTAAPATIAAENGSPISLKEGKVFIYFFDPHCLHCLAAGRKLARLDWTGTRFIGVPTDAPASADRFMANSGLQDKGPVSTDLVPLRKLFPFDLPPAGVALENGYEKGMLLQFEDAEPAATLHRLGFAK